MYATHIPNIPPATLPSNEVKENESAPIRVGIYPPAKEPTIIPSIINDFRDIANTKTKVHYHDKIQEFFSPSLKYLWIKKNCAFYGINGIVPLFFLMVLFAMALILSISFLDGVVYIFCINKSRFGFSPT